MSDDDQRMTGRVAGTRRVLLTGAGAVGASVLLAACGTDSSGDGGSVASSAGVEPGGVEPGGTDGGSQGGVALAKTAEIPVGGGKIFAEWGVVVTQPAAGQFKAFSAICTHQACPVSRIEADSITCTCHGSRFSLTDGSPQGGPATRALPVREVTVTGGTITLA